MTKETYNKFCSDNYIGKHEMKQYTIWRVLSAAGPEETFTVIGLNEVYKNILGTWDWEVRDERGNIVPEKVILYGGAR